MLHFFVFVSEKRTATCNYELSDFSHANRRIHTKAFKSSTEPASRVLAKPKHVVCSVDTGNGELWPFLAKIVIAHERKEISHDKK